MPEKHAVLSASSAHRWLNCTASPRYEEQFPESTSEYAEEGSLAHEICELKVLKKFTNSITPETFKLRLNALKKDPLYQQEMERTSDTYIEHLTERAMQYDVSPYVTAEVQVSFTEYVPEGFGTCDCIMIGGDTLTITDYKHGKGIAVSAENNPQMRLYALGALSKYKSIYGDNIKNVRMVIEQPRIQDEPSEETISVEQLLNWGESIKIKAAKAYMGLGEFYPGEHCRFCRGKAQCKARADVNMALEEFKNCIPNNNEVNTSNDNLLTNAQIGDLLVRGKDLVKWYEDLEKYALSALLNGEEITGWKAVAGRSNRTFTNVDELLKKIIEDGYPESLVYERKPKTLTELETLIGKTDFNKMYGAYIIKPLGKPTLAPVTDKREPYKSAEADFKEVADGTI